MPENTNNTPTLSELANGAIPVATPVGMPKLNTETVRNVEMREVATPPKSAMPVEGTGNPMLDAAFLNLDKTTERLANESTKLLDEAEQKKIENAMESDNIDEVDSLETNTSNTYLVHTFDDDAIVYAQSITPIVSEVKTSRPVSGTETKSISMLPEEVYDEVEKKNISSEDDDEGLFEIDDEDFKLLDEDEESDDSNDDEEEIEKEKMIKETIRKEMNNNFDPVDKKINLSEFKISKKSISATKVISSINNQPIECADGVLYTEGRAVRMSAFSTMEIESLNPSEARSSNYYEFMKTKLDMIYNHIIDENKPKSMEAWAKITPNVSFDDYMFTAYKATFGLSNVLTYTCEDEKCSNIFLDKLPINNMLKFESDEVKEKYFDILHTGNTTSSKDNTYDVSLYQASDDYVFGLKTPSLYNTFIEPTLIDNTFRKKYDKLMILLTYIDCIYKIDRDTKELILINTNPSKTDKVITYKRRVKTFATIIKSLTSDQLQALQVETDKYDSANFDDDGNLIRPVVYIYPEKVCPKCGKTIKEVEMAPDSMLFMRHQLGLMKKV